MNGMRLAVTRRRRTSRGERNNNFWMMVQSRKPRTTPRRWLNHEKVPRLDSTSAGRYVKSLLDTPGECRNVSPYPSLTANAGLQTWLILPPAPGPQSHERVAAQTRETAAEQ